MQFLLFYRNITASEMEKLIDEICVKFGKDNKISDKEEAKAKLKEKLAAAKPKTHGTTVIYV